MGRVMVVILALIVGGCAGNPYKPANMPMKNGPLEINITDAWLDRTASRYLMSCTIKNTSAKSYRLKFLSICMNGVCSGQDLHDVVIGGYMNFYPKCATFQSLLKGANESPITAYTNHEELPVTTYTGGKIIRTRKKSSEDVD
jgi:hypothetical protein